MKTIVILSHVGFDNSPYCTYVHSHAKALKKQGFNVIVLAVINWIPFLSRFQKRKKNFMNRITGIGKPQKIDEVTVIYKKALTFSNLLYNSKINLNGISYYMSIKRIFKKIKNKEEIVLIDAHTYKMEGYAAYRLKKKYKDIVTTVTLHGTSFSRNTKTKNGIKAIKNILNNIDFTICVSSKLKNMANECGVNNTKIIYNGINQYEIEEKVTKRNKYNIISVGSLMPIKNHNLTILAIGRVLKEYPQIRLTIVGEGPEREKLEQLVKDEKLKEVVTFKGKIGNEEVLKLMKESYIYLMPSINEGFGIVYAEAMKSGCITIGTINEGIDGFIKDGINGFLVKPAVKEIVEKVRYIFKHPEEMNSISKKGIEDTKNLTWNNNAKKYIKLI